MFNFDHLNVHNWIFPFFQKNSFLNLLLFSTTHDESKNSHIKKSFHKDIVASLVHVL
jgi:hypothetical protein